jgi:hypothetical protein
MRGWLLRKPFFLAGLLACPLILLLCYYTNGSGQGNFFAARLLLPVACLSIGPYSAAAWIASVLAVIEWPVYGLTIDLAARKLWTIVAISVIHAVIAVWLFTGGSGMF